MAVHTSLGRLGEAVIASVYLPGDEDLTPPTAMDNLIAFGQEKKLPLIIGADANAHHFLWGSTDTNQRGEHLLEYLTSTDLDILNVGKTPTFRNIKR